MPSEKYEPTIATSALASSARTVGRISFQSSKILSAQNGGSGKSRLCSYHSALCSKKTTSCPRPCRDLQSARKVVACPLPQADEIDNPNITIFILGSAQRGRSLRHGH